MYLHSVFKELIRIKFSFFFFLLVEESSFLHLCLFVLSVFCESSQL